MSDKILNDPPCVVEIDGVKFATPEAVVILLQSVSEERDALREAVKYSLAIFEHMGLDKNCELLKDALDA